MTPEVRDRIFDPFFTTKGVGEGTGLGLSSAYGIVKQSGGHIEVTSEPGRGSAFHCYLPALPAALAEEQSAPEPQRVLSQAPQGAGRRILVVEDEDIVRTLLARTLERLGYTVETAEDPSFALPTLRERGDEFALVISDMMMPHMTGAEFAREVADSNPELPFVFISGYTEDVGAARRRRQRRLFLQKPFTSEALATTVREALGCRPGGRTNRDRAMDAKIELAEGICAPSRSGDCGRRRVGRPRCALVGSRGRVGAIAPAGSRSRSPPVVDPSTGALSIGHVPRHLLDVECRLVQPGPTRTGGRNSSARHRRFVPGLPGLALAALVKVVESTTKNSTPSFSGDRQGPAGMVALGGGAVTATGHRLHCRHQLPGYEIRNAKTVTAFRLGDWRQETDRLRRTHLRACTCLLRPGRPAVTSPLSEARHVMLPRRTVGPCSSTTFGRCLSSS